MEQLIDAEELKEHCLDLVEQVSEQGVTLVITVDAIAVAKLVSLSESIEVDDGSGRVSVDDVVVPMEVAWES